MSSNFAAPTRRLILGAGALSLLPFGVAAAQTPPAPAPAAPTLAPPTDPRMADRINGSPTAKLVVMEVFSYTCSHCAHFAAEVFPKIEANLISTGKLRYAWQEFPRDALDLAAAMLARALPADRFEAFTLDLLRTQKNWAFDPSRNSREELARLASFAGMSRELFDQTLADAGLKNAILLKASVAQKTFGIHGTPTFVTDGKIAAIELTYDSFVKFIGA